MKKAEQPEFLGTAPAAPGLNPQPDGPPPTPPGEEVLVERCRRGDVAAFADLVEKYQHRLFNAVHRMVAHDDDAQELTQEAFVRALQGIRRYRGQSRFYTWLFRIALNLCINHVRRPRPVALSCLTDAGQPLGRQADALRELVDQRTRSPGDQAQLHETHQRALQALAELDPAARAVVVLRDIEQLDYADVAAALDVPVGTVKSRLARARLAIRQRLAEPRPIPAEPGPRHDAPGRLRPPR